MIYTHSLITLSKPILIQLKRDSYTSGIKEPLGETFQVKVIGLRTPELDFALIAPTIDLEIDGVIFDEGKGNRDIYELKTLGGNQLITIRTNNVASVSPANS